MASFFRIVLFILLLLTSPLSALEEGILKIDQRVICPLILEDSPGAITIDYLMRNLQFYEEDGSLKKVWAVDLRGTYMSSEDFQSLMKMINQKTFPILRSLVLGTVFLKEEDWDRILLGALSWGSLQTIDVYNSFYDNRGIRPVLQKVRDRYGTCKLSRKLIFASQSYYRRLDLTMQWPKDCIREGILGPDWVTHHHQYYQDDHKRISRAAPLHFLTGDTDTDEKTLDDLVPDDVTVDRRSSSVEPHDERVDP